MKRANRSVILILLAFLASSTLPLGAWAQEKGNAEPAAGLVAALTGSAEVTRDSQPPAPIAVNESVFRLDVLETAADSLLEVTLNDGSSFLLDELSSVAILEYIIDADPQGLLSLARGRLRSIISTTFSSRSDSFRVLTKQGVMGVQGTEFDVIAMAQETELFVWAGEVSVTHIDPQFPDVQIVRAGETVRWRIDEPVPPPSKIETIPEAYLPPPMWQNGTRLPPLVPGPRVAWTNECRNTQSAIAIHRHGTCAAW